MDMRWAYTVDDSFVLCFHRAGFKGVVSTEGGQFTETFTISANDARRVIKRATLMLESGQTFPKLAAAIRTNIPKLVDLAHELDRLELLILRPKRQRG